MLTLFLTTHTRAHMHTRMHAHSHTQNILYIYTIIMYRGQSIFVTYGSDDLFKGTFPAIVLQVCKASCSVLWTSGEYKNTITYNVSFKNIQSNHDTPSWTNQECDKAERDIRFPCIDLTSDKKRITFTGCLPPKKKYKPSRAEDAEVA